MQRTGQEQGKQPADSCRLPRTGRDFISETGGDAGVGIFPSPPPPDHAISHIHEAAQFHRALHTGGITRRGARGGSRRRAGPFIRSDHGRAIRRRGSGGRAALPRIALQAEDGGGMAGAEKSTRSHCISATSSTGISSPSPPSCPCWKDSGTRCAIFWETTTTRWRPRKKAKVVSKRSECPATTISSATPACGSSCWIPTTSPLTSIRPAARRIWNRRRF